MRTVGPRVGPMVTLSAAAHVVLLGYAAVAVTQSPRVVYRPPAYVVDLVDAPPSPRSARAAGPQPAVTPEPPPTPAPARPAPTPPPSPAGSEMVEPNLRRQAELERQKQAELERQKQAELERQKQAELERQKQAELERQKQAELDARLARLREGRERIRTEEARRAEEARLQRERAERLEHLREERERIRTAAAAAAEAQARAAAAARLSAQQLEIKFKEYYDHARQRIDTYWILPEWVRVRDVDVVISVRVSRNGRILSTTIERRSGDPGLDESVARALERAKREGLPPLPQEYPDDVLDLGLIFNPSRRL